MLTEGKHLSVMPRGTRCYTLRSFAALKMTMSFFVDNVQAGMS